MFEGKTIICVRDKSSVIIAGDGQVTFGNTVLKGNAHKVRRLAEGRIIAGFAGSTADAVTLFEIFEEKLKKYNYQLKKSAVELSKAWRKDRVLGKLEALLLVADADDTLLISGSGDVLEPEKNIIAIGSGGNYAYAAAVALSENTKLAAHEIALRSLKIAADICIYTNSNFSFEEIRTEGDKK